MGAYKQNLVMRVIEASDSHTWESAVEEWEIVDCEEDEHHESSCICGKEELRFLFTIRNAYHDSLPAAEQKAFEEKNWEKVFDIMPFENDWTRRGDWYR